MERYGGHRERGGAVWRGGGGSSGGQGGRKTRSQTNPRLRSGRHVPPPRAPPVLRSFRGVFELLNKNSGLCIKLQFGKTKLSGGIIILISKKKIKPLQIFLDYSALGDLFLPPSSSSSPNCGKSCDAASDRHTETFNNNSSQLHFFSSPPSLRRNDF